MRRGGDPLRIEVRYRQSGSNVLPHRRAIELGQWRLCSDCLDSPPIGGAPAAGPSFRDRAMPEAE